MTIDLTPKVQQQINDLIKSGRFADEQTVIAKAIAKLTIRYQSVRPRLSDSSVCIQPLGRRPKPGNRQQRSVELPTSPPNLIDYQTAPETTRCLSKKFRQQPAVKNFFRPR
jgi:hypothetical protein